MLNSKTKSWIHENVSPLLAKEHQNSCDDFIDLFEKSLELIQGESSLEGFNDYEDILNEMRDGNTLARRRVFYNFQQFEKYMKLIVFIVNPAKYRQLLLQGSAFGPFAIELGIENYTTKFENYLSYFKSVKKLRNTNAHIYERMSENDINENKNYLLTMYLILAGKYKKEIDYAYNLKSVEESLNGMAYCDKIISDFEKKQQEGYSYIEVKWANKPDEKENFKQGTILELRDGYIASGEKHIKLTGEAGYGKTAAIEFMVYKDAQNYIVSAPKNSKAAIPVEIHMIDAKSGQTLIGLIAKKLNTTEDVCRMCLEINALNLYFDGFNEILDITLRKNMSLELEDLSEQYAGTVIVISDREHKGHVSVAEAFAYCNWVPLDQNDIRLFVQQNKKVRKFNISELAVKLILELLERNPSYFDNFSPITLCELMIITEHLKQIPEKETLDDRFIEAIMERERVEKKDLTTDTLEKYLMGLAILNKVRDENGKITYGEMEILKCFSEIQTSYGFKDFSDTRLALKLAVNLGLLLVEDDRYRFAKESYLIIFFKKAKKIGM